MLSHYCINLADKPRWVRSLHQATPVVPEPSVCWAGVAWCQRHRSASQWKNRRRNSWVQGHRPAHSKQNRRQLEQLMAKKSSDPLDWAESRCYKVLVHGPFPTGHCRLAPETEICCKTFSEKLVSYVPLNTSQESRFPQLLITKHSTEEKRIQKYQRSEKQTLTTKHHDTYDWFWSRCIMWPEEKTGSRKVPVDFIWVSERAEV